eukprot:7150364-Pyramimonas_sp.AAC.1
MDILGSLSGHLSGYLSGRPSGHRIGNPCCVRRGHYRRVNAHLDYAFQGQQRVRFSVPDVPSSPDI